MIAMKSLKENINTLLMLLCELTAGVLLLIDHNGFLSVILMGAGLLLTLIGLFSAIRYFRAEAEQAIMQHTLSRGLMQTAAGCLLLFGTPWLLSIFPLITSVCGVGLFLIGVMKVQQAADYCRLHLPCWKPTACNAALCLIGALLVMLNPFAIVDTLWTFAGIALVVSAAGDLITLLIKGKKA